MRFIWSALGSPSGLSNFVARIYYNITHMCMIYFSRPDYARLTRLSSYFVGNHLNEYAALGHPYISSYSLTDSLNWVLCMNPLMAKLLSEADFIEADITYKASVEMDYMFNVVTFNYATMRCKPCHTCILTPCMNMYTTFTAFFQQG